MYISKFYLKKKTFANVVNIWQILRDFFTKHLQRIQF